jgi:hypothetical protein
VFPLRHPSPKSFSGWLEGLFTFHSRSHWSSNARGQGGRTSSPAVLLLKGSGAWALCIDTGMGRSGLTEALLPAVPTPTS